MSPGSGMNADARSDRRPRTARYVLKVAAIYLLMPLAMILGAPAASAAQSSLTSGQKLNPGDRLLSPNGQYSLVMQSSDGNLVLYAGSTALWNTGPKGAGTWAVMQGDGNLVLYNGSQAKWSSQTGGFTGARLHLQDDANAVIYQGNHAIWSQVAGYLGHTLAPGATLVPGGRLISPNGQYSLVMQSSDGNLVLYAGSTALWNTGPKGAGTWAVMQGDGNLVLYNGSQAKWSSQTGGFTGARLHLQDDANAVIYQGNHAIWSRLTGLVGTSGPQHGVNGPQNIANSAIADQAERYANGAWQGQCLVFALAMIRQAGGPSWAFGLNTSTYQAQWADRAASIGAISDARRGDIIQWGGGAGGGQLHTAIITTSGSNPLVIDSNYGTFETVGRGAFSSRNPAGSAYRIWRVGRV